MLRYLSDEWLAALDDALRTAAVGAGEDALVIRQTVLGGPDGDRSYVLRLAGSGSAARQVDPSGAEAAIGDVSFVCDWSTAVAIARGEESAQSAFMAGRLRLGGDARRLMDLGESTSALDRVFAGIAADTDYTH